ncbi:type IV secretion system DNA-binding domain-containing protein [Ferrovum sp.]|uniref:type IV secretion system DNA-binding domain-containing protein n=1 Tax=Ferrovum sp. TaxID=2609467 RepID=UPI00261DDBD1|nr:type IV secretion system DNA-binding domain-containing protein [Ferrovum sp.]
MSIHDNNIKQSFVRGSDITWHRTDLLFKNLWRLGLVFSASAVVTGYSCFVLLTNSTVRSLAISNRQAVLENALGLHLFKVGVSAGVVSANLSPVDAISVTAPAWDKAAGSAWFSILAGLVAGAGIAFLLFSYQTRRGREYATDQWLRGAKIVPVETLVDLVKDEESEFEIGGVPIPLSKMTRNILFTGAMGTGKSQGLLHMLDRARKLNKKCVVYDKTGEFTEYYYRPGKDFILNPLDARCAAWSVFNDVIDDFDFAMIATYFVPENKNSSDPIWDNAARLLLEDILRIEYNKGAGRSMRGVSEAIMKSTLDDLAELLRSNKAMASGTINEKNERGSESVRLTLSTSPALRYFQYLPEPTPDNPSFSMREWSKIEDDSWAFITSSSTQHEAIKPFATVWIETALVGFMESRPDPRLKAMIFLDELASLQKMKALEMALVEARKFGICSILGLQNVAQMDITYGEDMAKVLFSNCQTKLILRVTDESTSKRYAELLGKEDVEEKSESNSFGEEASRDGVNIATRRNEREVVTASEIATLPDLTGYLQLPGDYPISRVKILYKSRTKFEPDYIKRSGLGAQDVFNATFGVGGGQVVTVGVPDAPKDSQAQAGPVPVDKKVPVQDAGGDVDYLKDFSDFDKSF